MQKCSSEEPENSRKVVATAKELSVGVRIMTNTHRSQAYAGERLSGFRALDLDTTGNSFWTGSVAHFILPLMLLLAIMLIMISISLKMPH